MRSKLKRRLRKKYKVGEFKQFAFTVLIMVDDVPDELGLMYDPIFEIVENEKLCLAGGGGKNYITIAVCDQGRKNTVTEEKAQLVVDEIKKLSFVKDAIRFPLMDAWNSTDEQYAEEDKLIEAEKKRLGAREMRD